MRSACRLKSPCECGGCLIPEVLGTYNGLQVALWSHVHHTTAACIALKRLSFLIILQRPTPPGPDLRPC